MRKFIVAAALALSALVTPLSQASAQSTEPQKDKEPSKLTLVLAGASHHFGQHEFWDNGQLRPFNEFNPGLGLEYKLSKHFHASAGTYKNSIYRQSFYAGIGIETDGSKPLGAGIELGGITGYAELPVIPSAIPYLRFGSQDGRVNFKLLGIPPIKNLTPAVLGLQMRVKIG